MTELDVGTLQWLMFECSPDNLGVALDSFRRTQAHIIRTGTDEAAATAAQMLAENAVDLRSFLPLWRHVAHGRPEAGLCPDELAEESAKNLALLRELGLTMLGAQSEDRIGAIHSSNLCRMARATHDGTLNTHWGNDYASGLRDTMQKGAIFVTTNPVLVGIAAKESPAYWTPVRDAVRAQNPSATPEKIAEIMTIKVVVGNARLLRHIWYLSGGKLGLVSLQLSPKDAFDAEVMIEGALRIWEQLKYELGGTPNCVFKVPGTKAGITVAGELTKRGIGVNVTVNYSLPQQIAFAGVIEQNSTAPLSFRTQMDGRVDDPIGEELKEAGVSDWEELKTWATTAIRQRDYRMLCMPPTEGGVGFQKSFCLGAAGRGPWNISRSITDGPATLFLTVFPQRQVEFDSEPREINPRALFEPVPADKLDTLLRKSPLFRQSYKPDGMTTDEFDTYLPVQQTLTQFSKGYDDFVAWCGGDDSVYAA